eukprot:CAMPEP_0202976608 /NCGR_PEP_ID=MMETSP1396-20130829/78981_1 /ASSEMBLY_ACC=CAM_ASM_000872 /TAXON_ID= /ORGANISM="Pseudokeronopsis sp., Strain Brazil" /LENGTH=49 /DNA_ID= /DNA_START= /DNA_END= /DNA_ORIENTATION=
MPMQKKMQQNEMIVFDLMYLLQHVVHDEMVIHSDFDCSVQVTDYDFDEN